MKKKFKTLFRSLNKFIKSGSIYKNVSLKKYTSYKIGGIARILIEPGNLEEFCKTLLFLEKKNIEYIVIGNGTNLLIEEKIFDRVFIRIADKYSRIELIDDMTIHAEAGALLSSVANFAKDRSLTGMEEGFGIPGTVGGAVYMNASSHLYETKNVVTGVLAFANGKITLFKNEQMGFEYRKSIFQEIKNIVILRVEFSLKKGDCKKIKQKMIDILKARKDKQPDCFNAGSVFKQLEWFNVSKEIDLAGFKGFTIGGARVSEIHANFIENFNNASFYDVLFIINYIKKHFLEKNNVELQTEIRILQ